MLTKPINGHLILIMAPSGSGKGLLINYLRATMPQVHFPVSCTTRTMRPGEKEGEMYYFITREDFEQRVKDDLFLEWAEFGGDLYGTLKSEILPPLERGDLVIREVELQGILAFREIIPRDHYTVIYVEAGEWDVLCKRILARAPITEEQLELRRLRYLEESKAKVFADKIIENNENRLEDAKRELHDFVESINQKISAI